MTEQEKNIESTQQIEPEVAEQEVQAAAQDTDATEQIAACQAEVEHLKEQLMRERADFTNYKARSDKERGLWIRSGQSRLLLDMLVVVDDFDRALAEHEKKERTPELEAWLEGFELIGKELYKLLDKYGVKAMQADVAFDPEKHEALVQVDSADHESGQIVAVLQKGFMFNDEVLRPAKVSVAK